MEVNKYQLCYSLANDPEYGYQWNYLFSSMDKEECTNTGEQVFQQNPHVTIVMFDTKTGEEYQFWGKKDGKEG